MVLLTAKHMQYPWSSTSNSSYSGIPVASFPGHLPLHFRESLSDLWTALADFLETRAWVLVPAARWEGSNYKRERYFRNTGIRYSIDTSTMTTCTFSEYTLITVGLYHDVTMMSYFHWMEVEATATHQCTCQGCLWTHSLGWRLGTCFHEQLNVVLTSLSHQ